MASIINGLWAFEIQDATVSISGAGVSVLDSSGIDLSSDVQMDAFDSVELGGFSGSAGLTLHGSSPIVLSFSNWTFGVQVSSNVDASDVASGSDIQFLNASGPRMGSVFEKDPNGVVAWTPDGGGTGQISGVVSYAGAQGGEYRVFVTTDPAGDAGSLGGVPVVSSGTPYVINLQAPNTWYVFAYKSFGEKPAGVDARGGFGHPGSFRSEPVFVGPDADVPNVDVTIVDWGSVSGREIGRAHV